MGGGSQNPLCNHLLPLINPMKPYLSVKQSLAISLLQVYLNPLCEVVEEPVLPIFIVCDCLIDLCPWELLHGERLTQKCYLVDVHPLDEGPSVSKSHDPHPGNCHHNHIIQSMCHRILETKRLLHILTCWHRVNSKPWPLVCEMSILPLYYEGYTTPQFPCRSCCHLSPLFDLPGMPQLGGQKEVI